MIPTMTTNAMPNVILASLFMLCIITHIGKHGNSDERKRGERQKRNANKAEIRNVLRRAGNAKSARRNALRQDFIIEKILVDGNEHANHGERQNIASDFCIFFQNADKQNNHERINTNALIPAQHARRKSANIGKIQTTKHRDKCDRPGKIWEIGVFSVHTLYHIRLFLGWKNDFGVDIFGIKCPIKEFYNIFVGDFFSPIQCFTYGDNVPFIS